MRWSKLEDRFIILRTTIWPSLTTTRSAILLGPTMAQMGAGGTLVTFDLHGGKAACFRFMDAMGLIDIANNLGDSKSLATHPATTTHMRVGAEERTRLGIGDGTVRLSVGLEDVADIIDDLSQALDAVAAAPARAAE